MMKGWEGWQWDICKVFKHLPKLPILYVYQKYQNDSNFTIQIFNLEKTIASWKNSYAEDQFTVLVHL